MMNRMAMHERLKNLRKNYHMTLKELSEKLGFAENTIHNYENGKRQPDIETFKQYAEVFNVTIEEIIYDDGHKIKVFESWVNRKKILFFMQNENVTIADNDLDFKLFFEPTGDGCIAWGHVDVELFDGDADAIVRDLTFKDRDYKRYGRDVIERIWDFHYNNEQVSLITGVSTREDKEFWEFIGVEWQDGPWEEEIEENTFTIYR